MTERQLIEKCLANDAGSQRLLFDTYSQGIMTVCRRYTGNPQEAEDVMQETFIRVFSNLGQFRFESPLEGWIRRIASNTAIRYIKRNRLDFREVQDTDAVITQDALSNIHQEELLAMIQQLPSGYRTVFNLYVIDDYSHDEIARLLDIEPVTSRTQLAKARKMLQKKIEMMQQAEKYER